jgi:hypothetical protein
MSFETHPYFDINAGAPIPTKLRCGLSPGSSPNTTSTLKESRCSPPTIPPGDERPDSRSGQNEGATDAAVHVRAQRPENQIIVPTRSAANWADTMDHATTDITPTPVLYRYFGSSSSTPLA